MLRLIKSERGRKGVWRTYQHARLGHIEVVTMYGENSAADVIHIQHIQRRAARRQPASGDNACRGRGGPVRQGANRKGETS
jgi:hypothetical protein